MFGSRQMLKHTNTSHLYLDSSLKQQNKLVKYLGGHLDSSLTLEEHVKQKSKAAMLNFTKIKAIRPSLNATTCITLVLMLCISCLDYSNAMLYVITKKLLQKYQIIQTMWGKLVLSKCKYDSATKCLNQLHWLPIEQHIQYKILVTTHKSLNGNAPNYIKEPIKEKQAPSRSLRSGSSGRLLHTQRIWKDILI